MADIILNMTPELKDAFIQRVQAEHGQTVCANFTLDILLTATQQRLIAVEKALKDANDQNAALQLRCQAADKTILELTEELNQDRKLLFRLCIGY